jgi:hypothetical protein
MRLKSPLGSSRSYAFLHLAVLIFSFHLIPAQIAHGQPPSATSTQAADQQAASPAVLNAGVRTLTEKIVEAVKPSRAISLEIKNISSLGAADVEAIRKALEAELQTEGLRIGSSGVAVEVTLSENVESYIWVAEIRRNSKEERGPRIAIVSIPRELREIVNEPKELLVLSQRLVWKQDAKMLDFAIVANPSASFSRLLVLGTEGLKFYRADGARWELERDVLISHSITWARNVSGWIDTHENRAYVRGVVCDGDFRQPESVRCGPSDQNEARPELRFKIQGRENVDTATVGPVCGESLAILATGTADWTQLDSIQGYLSRGGRIVESGVAIETGGPVLSMYPNEAPGSARAVVWNLKTGNYEGYIVTATCNH